MRSSPASRVRTASVRVVHSRGTVVRSADGWVERAVGTCQDVTDRKNAEVPVRASQQMMAHLLEQFPNGTVNLLDADLRYVTVMGQGLIHIGATPADLVGRTLDELFPSERTAVVEGPYHRAFAGETATVDLSLAGRTYALSSAPFEWLDGAVRTIVVVVHDISERLKAEQERVARREQRARLEGMLFTARDLAACATHNLATSTGAIQRLSPEGSLAPHVRDAIDAATAGLQEATRVISELQRLIDAGSPARAADRA